MKIRSLFGKGLVAAIALSALFGGSANAAKITATTSGIDSGVDAILDELLPNTSPIVLGADNFFTVSFDEGAAGEFVDSVIFDLSADPDAVFDNQDFFFFQSKPEVGSSFGISASDISFSQVTRANFDNPNPTQTLEISFEPGSFGVGDFFSFGVDTNGVGDDTVPEFASLSSFTNDAIETFNDTGSDFGNSLATFSVQLENGNSTTVGFDDVGNYTSIASATLVNHLARTSTRSSRIAATSIPTEEDNLKGITQALASQESVTSVPESKAIIALLLLGAYGCVKHRQRFSNV